MSESTPCDAFCDAAMPCDHCDLEVVVDQLHALEHRKVLKEALEGASRDVKIVKPRIAGSEFRNQEEFKDEIRITFHFIEFRFFFKIITKFLSSFLCIFTYSYFFGFLGFLCLCLRSSRGEEIHSTGEVRFEIFYEGKEGKCVSFRKVLVGGNGRKWRHKLPLVLGLEFRCLTMRCVVARCRSQ